MWSLRVVRIRCRRALRIHVSRFVRKLLDLDAIDGLPEGIGELKGHALAVKRFDRSADGPVHIEDFAQVFGVYPDDTRRPTTG
jgi:hypothetical protein